MRSGKILLMGTYVGVAAVSGWYGYGAWLASSFPKVEIRATTPLEAERTRALPFFELMSPLPHLAGQQVLPKLEYKKGPPERYLERISVLLQADAHSARERIIYHGRRSRTDLRGLSAFAEEPAREAKYVEAAIRLSQGESVPALDGIWGFFYKPFLLREAKNWLSGVEKVTIMDQAGTPAFLFEAATGPEGRARATALFVRRNSFYRVDYLGDRGFGLLDPEALFRKTFLTERRADALEFVAKGLSQVSLRQGAGLKLEEVAWPVLLLAANVSVDPASLDSYFHFAGINALLYRNLSAENTDLEISDTLRSNVLASDLYAQDVDPQAAKTAEISRLARLLTRNFEQ